MRPLVLSWVKVQFRGIKRWFDVEITVVCLVRKVRCYFFKELVAVTSNQVFNSLRIDRFFTRHPNLPGLWREYDRGKGQRQLKEIPLRLTRRREVNSTLMHVVELHSENV